MNVLALDGPLNGQNVVIPASTQENDLVEVEGATYRLERWVPSSDELVLMTAEGRREPEIMAELGLSV